MKKKEIIKAMNGHVVEMTEEKAKEARKLIEGKGMKVDKRFWKIERGLCFLYFDTSDNRFSISRKVEDDKLMPWKKFKSMFEKKKNKVIIVGVDFISEQKGSMDECIKLILADASESFLKLNKNLMQLKNKRIESETTDTPKPEKELQEGSLNLKTKTSTNYSDLNRKKEQEIDWSVKDQLVVFEGVYHGIVVKTDGQNSEDMFTGQIVKVIKGSMFKVGVCVQSFCKSEFKPYTENLTDFEKLDPIVRELMLFERKRLGESWTFGITKFEWRESIVGPQPWALLINFKQEPQPLIEAYKAKASEHPELMDVFSRFAPIEHIVEATEMIDWSKIQVVESKYSVVLTSGQNNKYSFSGIKIKSKEMMPIKRIGHFTDKWPKSNFKLCKDQTVKFD